jgi:hypothetical protein
LGSSSGHSIRELEPSRETDTAGSIPSNPAAQCTHLLLCHKLGISVLCGMFSVKANAFFFLCGTGELRAYNLSLSASPFFLMMIGSRELFAQDGFKLQSF